MFSKRLEDLIQAALQDGVLTEQEKEIIMKRAQAEGEDKDEVEMYIQSLIQQQKQQEQNQSADHRIINDMISKITKMSNSLSVKNGKISIIDERNEISQERYEELMADGNEEFLEKEEWHCGDKFYVVKRYDRYFSFMNELENVYGDLPKVKTFLLGQKRKEMEVLSEKILYDIKRYKEESSSTWKLDYISDAEMCLKTIVGSYGFIPDAQSLITEHQKTIEKIKSSLRYKLAKIGKWIPT